MVIVVAGTVIVVAVLAVLVPPLVLSNTNAPKSGNVDAGVATPMGATGVWPVIGTVMGLPLYVPVTTSP